MREFTRIKTVLFVAMCNVLNNIKYGEMTNEVKVLQEERRKQIAALEADYDKIFDWLSENKTTDPKWEDYVRKLAELEANVKALEREPVKFSGLNEVSTLNLGRQ